MSIYNVLLGAAKSSAPFSISYVTRAGSSPANTTSDTYTNVSIGTAGSTRIVILTVTGDNNAGGIGGVTSVTCGGNAMTAQINLTTSRAPASIWTLAVPTGTTATFVINHVSGTYAAEVYVMYNTTNSGTATSTAAAYTAGTYPSMTLTMPSAGGAIYAMGGILNPTLSFGTINDSFTLANSITATVALFTPTTAGSVTNTVSTGNSYSRMTYACASFV
jgi:hypothetical protein